MSTRPLLSTPLCSLLSLLFILPFLCLPFHFPWSHLPAQPQTSPNTKNNKKREYVNEAKDTTWSSSVSCSFDSDFVEGRTNGCYCIPPSVVWHTHRVLYTHFHSRLSYLSSFLNPRAWIQKTVRKRRKHKRRIKGEDEGFNCTLF